MGPSGFHIWQFEVFNYGAGGLLVILFWLDLWEISFLPALGFELGTSGLLVLHCTTVPWWLVVFTSDNLRYLSLVQRDWWWYCADFTYERFSFCLHWSLNWGSVDLKSCTLPLHCSDFWFSTSWQFHVFNSCVEGLGVVLLWLDLWEIFILPALGFELETCTLPLQHGALWFSPLTILGIKDRCRGIGGGIVLIGPVRDFFFANTGVQTGDLWISSPALYHCTMETSGFQPLTIWGI